MTNISLLVNVAVALAAAAAASSPSAQTTTDASLSRAAKRGAAAATGRNREMTSVLAVAAQLKTQNPKEHKPAAPARREATGTRLGIEKASEIRPPGGHSPSLDEGSKVQ